MTGSEYTSSGSRFRKNKHYYFIEENNFYSSQFKRNFVKGMLTLASYKGIQDMTLFMREMAPTIMFKASDTYVWVIAYLIIFKIEHKAKMG